MNIPLEEWSGSGETAKLHATMKQFVETSGKQSRVMINLTWAIAGLTFVMLVAVIIQIYLIWPQ